MMKARAGTVTLLFTDIERSTELLQRLGDDSAQALWRAYLKLLRNAITTRGGHEIKSLGDGLMVVFNSALDALACSVAMQQAVHRHNQGQEESHCMQLRIGLNVGEPIRAEEDYFGTPVVIARRLCECARGGKSWRRTSCAA